MSRPGCTASRTSVLIFASLTACSTSGSPTDASGDVAATSADLRAPGPDALADLSGEEDAGACGGDLQPLAAARFGESPHVQGRHLVQLSDSQLFTCGALDGSPGCSCVAPCSCWSLQIPVDANPAPGDYALAERGASYTVQRSNNGGWSSSTYVITAGTLHLRAVQQDGLAGVLCGAVARGLGPLPIAGAFGATRCP